MLFSSVEDIIQHYTLQNRGDSEEMKDSKRKTVFGEKVKAERMSLMLGDKLHSAWFPRIEVNGHMCLIKDQSTPAGYMEAETRYKALKKGKEALQRCKEKHRGE